MPKSSIFFLNMFLLFFLFSTNAFSCVVPYDDLYVNTDTVLCGGTYYLDDFGSFAVITVENAILDMNQTILIGNRNVTPSTSVGVNIGKNAILKNGEIIDYGTSIQVGTDNITIENIIARNNVYHGLYGEEFGTNISIINITSKNNLQFGIVLKNYQDVYLSDIISTNNTNYGITTTNITNLDIDNVDCNTQTSVSNGGCVYLIDTQYFNISNSFSDGIRRFLRLTGNSNYGNIFNNYAISSVNSILVVGDYSSSIARYNNFTNNTFVYTGTGFGNCISLGSNNATFKNNTLISSSLNGCIQANTIYNDLDTSNTCNGLPIYYLTGSNIYYDTNLFETQTNEILVVGSNNVILKNQMFTNPNQHLQIDTSNNVYLENIFINNSFGLAITDSNATIINLIMKYTYGLDCDTFLLSSPSNCLIYDGIISDSFGSDSNYLYLSNLTFINVTSDTISQYYYDVDGNLTVGWYLDGNIYRTDIFTPINADVIVKDKNNNIIYQQNTNNIHTILKEYTKWDVGNETFYPYSLEVSSSNFSPLSFSGINSTNNIFQSIGLDFILPNTTSKFCFDNDTLYEKTVINFMIENQSKIIETDEKISCQYGCDSVTNNCNPSKLEIATILFLIIISLLIVFAIVKRLWL